VECGVRKFVFSSTCATYGPPDRVPMTEDLPQRPINPYGEAKLMFEKVLIWYQQLYKLEFIAFRYFNAAGASEKFGEHHRTETHIIPNVLQVALGQKPQVRYLWHGLSDARRHVRPRLHPHQGPRAGAHARIAAGQDRLFQSGQRRRLFRPAGHLGLRKVTGKKIPTVEKPRRPGDPPRLVASAEKAIRDLGWKPKYPKLEDIVATPGPGTKASERLSGLRIPA